MNNTFKRMSGRAASSQMGQKLLIQHLGADGETFMNNLDAVLTEFYDSKVSSSVQTNLFRLVMQINIIIEDEIVSRRELGDLETALRKASKDLVDLCLGDEEHIIPQQLSTQFIDFNTELMIFLEPYFKNGSRQKFSRAFERIGNEEFLVFLAEEGDMSRDLGLSIGVLTTRFPDIENKGMEERHVEVLTRLELKEEAPSLSDFLAEPTLKPYFNEYCLQQGVAGVLRFLNEVDDYRNTQSKVMRMNSGRKICFKYLDPQAETYLADDIASANLKATLFAAISAFGENPSKYRSSLFKKIQKACKQFLNVQYENFLSSEYYERFRRHEPAEIE